MNGLDSSNSTVEVDCSAKNPELSINQQLGRLAGQSVSGVWIGQGVLGATGAVALSNSLVIHLE